MTGLFEPFRRPSGRTGTRPGTGLGLSIVASVAKAHGGHAEARARPDGGLDVQITLPATANGQRLAPHQRQAIAPHARQPDLFPLLKTKATRQQDESAGASERPDRSC